jgi:hypothetical protein
MICEDDQFIATIRDRFCGGEGEKGLAEILMLQLLTNPQAGTDPNLPLYLMLFAGGKHHHHGQFKKLAVMSLLTQQQAQVAASGTTVAPPASNMLLLALALGLFGEEDREVVLGPSRIAKEDIDEDINIKKTIRK